PWPGSCINERLHRLLPFSTPFEGTSRLERVVEKAIWIWTAALESGFQPLPELIRWADEQISRLDEPPQWLLDLSLTRSTEEALGVLWQAWTGRVESTG